MSLGETSHVSKHPESNPRPLLSGGDRHRISKALEILLMKLFSFLAVKAALLFSNSASVSYLLLGDFRFKYKYENDFSIVVCRLHIVTTHTHLIP